MKLDRYTESIPTLNANRSVFKGALDNIRMLNFERNVTLEVINIIDNCLETQDMYNTRDLLKLKKKYESKLRQLEAEKRQQQIIIDQFISRR